MKIKNQPVYLLRLGLAALMAELIPLIILMLVIMAYGYFAAPGQEKGVYEAFAQKAGTYIGPIAGTFAALGMGFWAASVPLTRLLHGALTGFLIILLDIAVFAYPTADFELSQVLVLAAKFLAALLGGYLAQRRYQNLPKDARKTHRLI